MSHIMLDLETMGNGNRAAIIAIGAVSFNSSGVNQRFYQRVRLDMSIDAGMEMDASTVLWWLQQSDAARSEFKDNHDASSLCDALDDFSRWYVAVGGVEVWGNGAAFDNTILSSAYRLTGIEQPWKFWNDRCYRTLKAMYPQVKMARSGTHHNAVDDAHSQADHLIQICNAIGAIL